MYIITLHTKLDRGDLEMCLMCVSGGECAGEVRRWSI